MKYLLFFLLAFFASEVSAQNYNDSLSQYRSNYISTHGVVKGDHSSKLAFYDIDPSYRVLAKFEKKDNSPWFQMKTTGKIQKKYRVYGIIRFLLQGKEHQLIIYQSQDLLNTSYKNYLFLPFTDETNGTETYITGRYIDLQMEDIATGTAIIDFNKAYNPYCAYVDDVYNCPVPPRENNLQLYLKAGEKSYSK